MNNGIRGYNRLEEVAKEAKEKFDTRDAILWAVIWVRIL